MAAAIICAILFFTVRINGEDLCGEPNHPEDFPWHASIYQNGTQNLHVCSGTLLSEDKVVTAAHCVREGSSYVVRFLNVKLADVQEVKVRQIIIHENYDVVTKKNDIALLFLAKKVKLSDTIHSICLPGYEVKTFTNGFVIGCYEIGEYAHCLHESGLMRDGFYCAYIGIELRTSLCNGTSGSGMYVHESGKWHITGIFLYSSKRGDGKDYAEFLDVSKYRDWINEQTMEVRSDKKCQEYMKKGYTNYMGNTTIYYSAVLLTMNFTIFSSGYYISPNYIITEAQIINGHRASFIEEGIILFVEGYLASTKISDVTIHPDYVPGLFYNDLALVKSSDSFQFKPSDLEIHLACLYSSKNIDESNIYLIAKEDNEKAKILSRSECQTLLGTNIEGLPNGVTDSLICTHEAPSFSAGLYIDYPEYSTLIALTTYDIQCARNVNFKDCNLEIHVYTNISHHLDWIESVVWPL